MNARAEAKHEARPRPLVIGLIGGIGSGKSEVAAAFQRYGACVIAADRLGHDALRQPAIREQVIGRWGREILDAVGEVDRQRLGQIVFADAAERRALESLVFPWIEQGCREAMAACANEVPLIVLDAAIMVEAGWDKLCDRIVFVDAPRAVRLERVARQRGWSAKEVEARERAQMSLNDKAARAGIVIDNSGTPDHMARQVDDLLDQWGVTKPGAAR
jgi:dephospho-CoA kinase